MKDYVIMTRGDANQLSELVNTMMEEGYEPIGGVAITHIGYTQALLKVEKKVRRAVAKNAS